MAKNANESTIFENASKNEYLCQVTIIESRNLKPLNSIASGLCTPYIKVKVADLPAQVTSPIEKTNSAIWNQQFTFSNVL